MNAIRIKVSAGANAKYVEFVNQVRGTNDLFQSTGALDRLLKAATKRLGRRMQIKMGSRFLYKSFNRNYFFKNLYKNIVVLEYLSTVREIGNEAVSYTVNDIGCGSAPSAIAYELLFDHKDEMCFNLKDNSKYQMRVAKEMLGCRGISRVHLDRSKLTARDFRGLRGLTFFSYFLCEQTKQELLLLRNNISQANGQFICIDYENKLREYADSLTGRTSVFRFKLSVRLEPEVKAILGVKDVIVNGLYFDTEADG